MFGATKQSLFTKAAMVFALFCCIAALCFLSVPKAWGGYTYSGEVDTSWYDEGQDTFVLTTQAQLAGLANLTGEQSVTFAGKTVLLGADIDLSSCEWEPIGNPYNSNKAFMGTFDGQGHSVTGLTINNTESNQALFGSVKRATITNLSVKGNVVAGQGAAGIIALADRSQLSNLTNYVTVTAAGAVPSYNDEKSYNGSASGVVCYSTGLDAGGESVYENLVNYGNIRATSPSGCAGTVGSLVAAEGYTFRLVNCENHGNIYVSKAENVEGLQDGAGGVLGSTAISGTYLLTGCSNTGNVSSNNLGSIGGVAGTIQGTGSQIDHSSNTGSVTNLGVNVDAPTDDTPTAAGLVSQFESTDGKITNNYSSGTVSAATGYSAAIIGATSGDIADIASNNYYLDESSTGAFNDQVTGDSSDRIMSGSSATAEQMEQLMDPEAGGVAEIDYSQYKMVPIDTPEEEQADETEIKESTIDPEWGWKISLIFAVVVMICGAIAEGILFGRQRSFREVSVG